MVAVEELEEGGLGAGGALDAAHLEAAALEMEPLEIEQEVLQPQAGAFADRGRLGGLEVGHAEGRLVGPLVGETGEGRDHRQHPRDHEVEGVAGDDEVGVVADEGRGRAEVEDRPGRRRTVGKGLEVGHDVVPGALFVLPHPLEIVGGHLEVGPHLLDGLVRNVEPELVLGRGQRQPQPPPGGVAVARLKRAAASRRGVAAGQRVVKAIERGHRSS